MNEAFTLFPDAVPFTTRVLLNRIWYHPSVVFIVPVMRIVSPTFPRWVVGVMEVIFTSTAFTRGEIICGKIVKVNKAISVIIIVFFFKLLLSNAPKFTGDVKHLL